MSNLLKRGTTVNKDERIIDYNDLIRAKLQSIMVENTSNVDPDGFVSGLHADVVEELVSDADIDMLTDESVDPEVRQAEANKQIAIALENANTEAAGIIAEATNQANEVLDNASKEAERIAVEAEQRGYQEGINKAEQEINNRIAELETEYENKKNALEKEYDDLKAQIEPELVSVLTEVFSKVTKTVAEDNYEIILHLINDVMRKADGAREFVIRVSSDDYKFLINNQGKIYCALSKDVNIDIIEDVTMSRNQCTIETNTGIFNCGLDIELANLTRDLKLLSCI